MQHFFMLISLSDVNDHAPQFRDMQHFFMLISLSDVNDHAPQFRDMQHAVTFSESVNVGTKFLIGYVLDHDCSLEHRARK